MKALMKSVNQASIPALIELQSKFNQKARFKCSIEIETWIEWLDLIEIFSLKSLHKLTLLLVILEGFMSVCHIWNDFEFALWNCVWPEAVIIWIRCDLWFVSEAKRAKNFGKCFVSAYFQGKAEGSWQNTFLMKIYVSWVECELQGNKRVIFPAPKTLTKLKPLVSPFMAPGLLSTAVLSKWDFSIRAAFKPLERMPKELTVERM